MLQDPFFPPECHNQTTHLNNPHRRKTSENKSILNIQPPQIHRLTQRCTTLLGKGPQCIIFSAREGRRQNYELKFQESSIKKLIFLNLTSLFIACSLIFLPS